LEYADRIKNLVQDVPFLLAGNDRKPIEQGYQKMSQIQLEQDGFRAFSDLLLIFDYIF